MESNLPEHNDMILRTDSAPLFSREKLNKKFEQANQTWAKFRKMRFAKPYKYGHSEKNVHE